MPNAVDSAAVAGVIDLLRAQGSWFLAVRYGARRVLFVPPRPASRN